MRVYNVINSKKYDRQPDDQKSCPMSNFTRERCVQLHHSWVLWDTVFADWPATWTANQKLPQHVPSVVTVPWIDAGWPQHCFWRAVRDFGWPLCSWKCRRSFLHLPKQYISASDITPIFQLGRYPIYLSCLSYPPILSISAAYPIQPRSLISIIYCLNISFSVLYSYIIQQFVRWLNREFERTFCFFWIYGRTKNWSSCEQTRWRFDHWSGWVWNCEFSEIIGWNINIQIKNILCSSILNKSVCKKEKDNFWKDSWSE